MPTVTPRAESIVIKPVPGRRHQLRRWLWRIALALLVIAPLVFMLAGLGSKAGLWSWQFGLGVLTRKLGTWLLFGAILFGAASAVAGVLIRPRSRTAILAGAGALAVGLAGLAWGASVQRTAANLPFIHDISTDTQNPPVFEGRILAEREGLNSLDYVGKRDARDNELVSVLQARSYPGIRPIVTSRSVEDAQGRARDVAAQLGWEIKDEAPGRIEATDTTFWYGFEDDVVVRIREGAGGGAVVDVRSVSREGGSDLGANAERVRDFLEAFGR